MKDDIHGNKYTMNDRKITFVHVFI